MQAKKEIISEPVTSKSQASYFIKKAGLLRLITNKMKEVKMDFVFPPLVKGMLLKRLNRFLAEVDVGGRKILAHVPNSGRMEELLAEGVGCWLSKQNKTERKTTHDLVLVEYNEEIIAIDSRLPNHILENALKYRKLPDMTGIVSWKREAAIGKSRIDFCLFDGRGRIWVEVKSVNLVIDGTATFPDAPTTRGTRHLLELRELIKKGDRAEIIFIVLRSDAKCFTPFALRDPDFSFALSQAAKEGVKARAFTSGVSTRGIILLNEIPVHLE